MTTTVYGMQREIRKGIIFRKNGRSVSKNIYERLSIKDNKGEGTWKIDYIGMK